MRYSVCVCARGGGGVTAAAGLPKCFSEYVYVWPCMRTGV